MQLMYLLSIAAAAQSIKLSAAYFMRGVRVQIIVPGHETDSPAVHRASRSTWRELLRAGVEFYEYQPTFFHCKVMIVDERWICVGSTNVARSRCASSRTTSSALELVAAHDGAFQFAALTKKGYS